MIINIGSKGDKIITYLKNITVVNQMFTWWIFFWKPVIEPKNWPYLYINLENNGVKINSDNKGVRAKVALFDFVIVGNDKTIPDVEMYEMLDLLSNNIRTFNKTSIDLDGFKILNIEEWQQSGVLRTEKENPFIVAQYNIIYQYLYL